MSQVDISPNALLRLRHLATDATPGPWHANVSPDRNHLDSVDAEYKSGAPDTICLVGRSGLDQQNADSEYMAAANPDVILALLDRIDKLDDALFWCSASQDFAPGGQARAGWERLCMPLLTRARERAKG